MSADRDIWQAVNSALGASCDGCARCKTCERQTDAVFAAIYEAGYIISPMAARLLASHSREERAHG